MPYNHANIAAWLMGKKEIQRLRQGKKPFDKEMVRDMLQNRTYTGRVRHTDTIYREGIGKAGKMKGSKRNRGEWFEGKHVPIITDDLFEECQHVRAGLVRHRNAPSKERIYLLHDRVFCVKCVANKPQGLVDDNYGKMRPKFYKSHGYAYYLCLSGQRGYEACGQPVITQIALDEQVVHILKHLEIPERVSGKGSCNDIIAENGCSDKERRMTRKASIT